MNNKGIKLIIIGVIVLSLGISLHQNINKSSELQYDYILSNKHEVDSTNATCNMASCKHKAEVESVAIKTESKSSDATPLFIEKTISGIEPCILSAGDFILDIPVGAVSSEKDLTIRGLRDNELPELNWGLVNVTSTYGGYRCLPHGKFDKPLQLSIGYDTSLIPIGYRPEDIRTFFYDENTEQWICMQADSINTEKQLVVSSTDHFTDFINGILTQPEIPNASGYTPTSIRNLDYANPLEGMNIMQAPTANNSGSCSMNFPFTIPSGRNGMTPLISISYNSDVKDGIMGPGWNLNIPTIAVDTRWGVPPYNTNVESESYLVNGEAIVEDTSITENIERRKPLYVKAGVARNTSGTKKYAYLKEGRFDKILRHGYSPNEYSWEVTDRNGIRYEYGYSGKNTLAETPNGNIAVWGLEKATDPHGNFIRYKYDTCTSEPYGDRHFRIDSIIYTGFENGNQIDDGLYIVHFEYDEPSNAPLSAIYGFLTSDNMLLTKIKITYDNRFVKCYRFEYSTEGSPQKKVLRAIAEITDSVMENYTIDYNNNTQRQGFYVHSFEYYDENYPSFSAPSSLDVPNDGSINLSILSDNINLGYNISKNHNYSITAGGSVCVGINDGKAWLKDNSVGINYHYTFSRNNQKSQFIDLNGDGIVDRVEKDLAGSINFYKGIRYPNSHIGFETQPITLTQLKRLGKSASHTNSLGGELLVASVKGMLGFSQSWTKTINSDYFIDVNGDGYIDFVSKGDVYLNFPDDEGYPNFNRMGNSATQISYDNCYKFGYGGSADVSIPSDKSLKTKRDPVIIWESPLSCFYNVDLDLRSHNAPDLDDNIWQGITIIDTNKNIIFSKYKVGPDDFNFNGTHPFENLYIPKGGYILFHIHSANEYSLNKLLNSITISAVEETLPNYASGLDTGDIDANNKHILFFNYGEDAVIQDGFPFTALHNGNVKLSASLSSNYQPMSDQLDYYLIRETFNSNDTSYIADTIRHHTFYSGLNISHSIVDSIISVSQFDRLSFRLESNSNVDWSNIDFTSNVKYIEGTSSCYDTANYHPSLGMSIYSKQLCMSQPVTLPTSTGQYYAVSPNEDLQNYIASNISADDKAYLTIKTTNNIIAKKIIVSGGQAVSGSLYFYPPQGQNIYYDYTVNGTISVGDTTYYNATVNQSFGGTTVQKPAGFYAKQHDSISIFGNLYRGWGQFSYLDSLFTESADYAISFEQLSTSDEIMSSNSMASMFNNISLSNYSANGDNSERANNLMNLINNSALADAKLRNFSPMIADINSGKWIDSYNSAFITKGEMGSGLGTKKLLDDIENNELAEEDDDMPNFDNPLSPGGRFPVVNRVSKNVSRSYSVSIFGLLGFNYTKNMTYGYSDMTDMNGDGFPDIVTPTEIQYTLPNGDMSNNKFTFPDEREVYTTNSEGYAIGASVSFKSSKLTEKTSNPSSLERNISTTAGLNDNTSENDMISSYIDINSDGLPDMVYYDKSSEKTYVEYNLGYSFSTPFQISNIYKIASNISQSNPWANGINVNFANYSYSAGINTNENTSGDKLTMMDINSDGFIDIISINNNTMTIYLNNGTDFNTNNNIFGIGTNNLSENKTFNISSNVSGSFGFLMTYVKITISLYGDFSYNLSNEKLRLMDINGDGAIDILMVNESTGINVRYGTPLKHHILRKVTTPALGEYEMSYSMLLPDNNNPKHKWIMTGLKIRDNDGFDINQDFEDSHDSIQYTFEYSRMKYHRIERENYGFAEIITNIVDDCNSQSPIVLRKQRELFHTENGLRHGLKYRDEICDANDILQTGIDYTWTLNDLNTGDVVEEYDCGEEQDVYPCLKSEQKTIYGNSSDNTLTSIKHYEYTCYGYIKKYNHNDSVTATMAYNHDRNRNILGRLIELTAKSANNVTLRKMRREYNENGDITKVINYMSDNALDTCGTDFKYDCYGNLAEVKYPANANGDRMFYRYTYEDSVYTYLWEVTDTFECTTKLRDYDYRFGKPRRVIAQNGAETIYTFYSDGKLESVKAPTDLAYSARFVYWNLLNSQNHNRWARTIHHDTINAGNTFVTQTVCDGLGRTMQTARKAVIDGTTKFVVSGKNVYDAYGRVVQTYQPQTINSLDNGSVFNGTFTNPTSYTYDCLDRQLSVTTPDDITVYKSYEISLDAFDNTTLLVTTTYPQGRILKSYTDYRGLQTTTTAIRTAGNITTKFKYSPMGELITSTDPEEHSTTYTYDMLGRLVERGHPDAGNTAFRYDKAGNLVVKETQKLQNAFGSITYSYYFNRLTEIHYPHNPEMDVYYEYGSSGLDKGLVTRRQDGVCVQSYSYNAMGDVVENIRTFAMPSGNLMTFATSWEYDTWGRTKTMTYPDGETIKYTYDNAGKAKGMYSRNNAIVSNIKYDKYGNRTRIDYGNGAYNRYTYDAQTLQLSRLRSFDATNTAMQDIAYTYDDLYNITALANTAAGEPYSCTYAYDTLNRLIESTGSATVGSNTPTYDFAMSYSPSGRILNYSLTGNKLVDGQLTAMNTEKTYYYTNNTHHHAPTGIAPSNPRLGINYSWDANGNFKETSGMALLSTRTAYFNEENRLSALGDWSTRNILVPLFGTTTSNAYVSSYLYDADGERVWKFAGTATMTYSNGQLVNSDLEMDKTFYPTPQTTFTKQKFYKHYFIGSERISTSNGQFVATAANTPPNVDFVNPSTTANSFIAGFNDQIAHALDSVGYSGNITIDPVFSCIYQQSAAKGIGPIQPPIVICATQYYYHYNHQGSVALLTNKCGNKAQHLQYLPYGGIFVDHRPGSYSSTYTFSAKEKDSESGYTYFGARYYSDGMMQWLSVDPMSDMRPGVSPYSYCQNNPIGRVDTWGMLDEIVIRGMDGSKTTYVPGMSSEGCDEFTAKVINNYNEAYNGSPTAREDIDNLVNAKGTYTVIKSRNGDNNFRQGTDENGNRGGTIFFNPEGVAVPTQKHPYSTLANIKNIGKDPVIDLMHETIHASRHEQGIRIPLNEFTTGSNTPDEEIATMHRENMVRRDLGAPLRTHYSWVKSEGRYTGAEGYQMLKFNKENGEIISNCPDYLR